MRLIEIPLKTLEDELNNLYAGVSDPAGPAYAAGAIDALNWLLHNRTTPSENIMRRHGVARDCQRIQ